MGNRKVWAAIALMASVMGPGGASAQQPPEPVESKFAEANGVRLHYLVAGQGDPVLLLHGFGQSSHMWRPLIRELARNHTVIAADLRGAGQSDAPDEGYAKSSMARDVHALMAGLGYDKVSVVGHDMGMMVAYAYAVQFPGDVKSLVLLDAFLPGVGEWTRVGLIRDQWHFHFFGKTPQALVQGRERIYLEYFWNEFAADPGKSIPEADRKIYAAELARPNHVRAGMEWFRLLDEDAKAADDADARARRRERVRRFPRQTDGADCYGRAGRSRTRRRPLADGRSAGLRDSQNSRVPRLARILNPSHDSAAALTRTARGDILLLHRRIS
jgi:pimeloyl-ACP methyl ester carboxylesterase